MEENKAEEKIVDSNESNEKKKDKLQTIDVPKYIKILSVIYIATSIATGFLNFAATYLEQGEITAEQTTHITTALGHVLTGFLYWGFGQVFSKLMEKKNK